MKTGESMNELQEKLNNSILNHKYSTAGETTVKMMIKEETDKLHKLNRELIIEMEEKDQLIKELTEERDELADYIIAKAIRKEWGHYETK